MLGNTVLLSLLRNTIELVGFSLLFLMLDSPKFSWKKTIVGYGIYTLGYIAVSTVWILIDMESYGKFVTLSIFAGALVMFPFMSRDNPFQVFYNLSLQIFILIMQIVVSIALSVAFFQGNPWADIGIRIVYLVLVILAYLRWLRKPFRELSDIQPKGWLLMSFVSVSGNLFVIYYWTQPQFLLLRSKSEQGIFFCIWTLLFVTHIIMIQALTSMKRETTAKSERELSSITNRMLARQLEMLEDSVEEARRIRHDARHHNLQIAEYAKCGDVEAILSYLGKYETEAEHQGVVTLCENSAANNILNAYTQKARKQGIEVRLNVEMEKIIAISDIDLVAMLANLLENAIHGCLQSGAAHPFIELYIGRKASKLIIHIQNTAGNNVVIEHGLPKSKNGKSIGVSSILHSAAKYGGEYDFQMKDGIFSCQILLKASQTCADGEKGR